MIRVLYRWQVAPEAAEGFLTWWHEGTVHIRSTSSGARGSTLLRAQEDPAIFVDVASWDSLDALVAFRQAARILSFEGADLQGMEVFEELDDLTGPPT